VIVVKIGGSLFDHPALGPGLRRYIESLGQAEVLLVAGGGPVADAVRELDRTHQLGEEAAHWLALRSLGVTASLLEALLCADGPPAPCASQTHPPAPARPASPPVDLETCRRRCSAVTPSLQGGGWGVGSPRDGGVELPGAAVVRLLDALTFAREDEARPGALPHTWSVTTDSIAARAALVFRAERLVLLKSVDIPPNTPWAIAAAHGWVDEHFPHIAQTLSCPIEVMNFRRQLDARA
jgi:hypothetical protein